MKKFLFLLLLVVGLATVGCESDKVSEGDEQGSVSFKIENLMEAAQKSTAFKADTKDWPELPECSDLKAKRVKITIAQKEYDIRIVDNGTLETNEIKLDAGQYSITSFGVFDKNDVAIYALPEVGSEYATLFNLNNLLSFEVKAFEKTKVDVNVICYTPATYEYFGFQWFQFVKHEVKEKCFYVNLCREDFDAWHEEGSPYFGQDYDGRYFSGIMEVTIKGDGWAATETNVEYFGNGAPLCVPYIDKIGSDDTYTYEINLLTPDGSKVLVHAGAFADSTKKFGGNDGVLDIRIGCKDLPYTECGECDWNCDPNVISDGKVEICHKLQIGNDWKFINLTVPASAVDAHLNHGDSLGSCE